jgi:hypothetical protein
VLVPSAVLLQACAGVLLLLQLLLRDQQHLAQAPVDSCINNWCCECATQNQV